MTELLNDDHSKPKKKKKKKKTSSVVENNGSVVVGKLTEGNKPSQGYDAQTEQYVDMFTKESLTP